MAQASNTYDTQDAVGLREDLTDTIFNTSPTETPFTSRIAGRGKKPKAVKCEWQNDDLAAADGDNAQDEGDEYNYEDSTPTARVGNYCQILSKGIVVSETLEEVEAAGRASEMAYQTVKRGKEWKRDLEKIVLSPQASSVVGKKRKMGGLGAWLETNTDRGTGGADGGYNTGTGYVDAPTDGTQRAFVKSQLDGVIRSCFDNGATPKIIMTGSANKQVFSGFTGISELRTAVNPESKKAAKQATLVGAADAYLSDFGLLLVITNRFQRSREVFVLDSDHVKLSWLRRMKRKKPSKTGDADKRIIIGEVTLRVDEKAHGAVADLT
ncbi:MAG: DUF5309 domain-containing protein [Phycisphaerales bacterium]|nr:DUF5309 domain-containing protein [Phycisphaerales bacterium]